jgi:CheY-like chemotaxis protein
MANSAKETFIHELDNTLTHLYDPAALRRSPLAPFFGLNPPADVIPALQRLLTSAVEALKPGDDVPATANAWRLYRILYYRYIEQFPQREVASDLALSIRQLRRQEKMALEVLADTLWARYHQNEAPSPPPQGESTDDQAAAGAPPLEEELARLEKTIPSELVEVATLVQSVLDTVQPLAQPLGVSIQCDLPPALPPLKVQLITMRQALLHVVSTATRCLPGGRVTLSVEVLPARAGIHLQVMTQRVNPASVVDKNVGQNLGVAAKLVQNSGGALQTTLNAQSDTPFTASIRLPTPEQIPVLAIDDNADTLRLWQRYLANSRYHLTSTVDPQEGLALAAELRPQIIVLDVMLPGIDGWEMLGRLRIHPHTRDAAIIVCSILPQEQLALALGAAEFMRKPVSKEVFLATLDRQLNRLWTAARSSP